MPGNGEINSEFGVYKTLCCDVEIVITQGATFPDCPNHANLSTVWKLISSGEKQEAEERGRAANEAA